MNTPSGEEWKQLDAATQHYNPEAFSTDLDAARKRIHDIRSKQVDLLITDRTGRPVPGLAVEIEQTSSAFSWGDQLWDLDTLFRPGHGGSDAADRGDAAAHGHHHQGNIGEAELAFVGRDVTGVIAVVFQQRDALPGAGQRRARNIGVSKIVSRISAPRAGAGLRLSRARKSK